MKIQNSLKSKTPMHERGSLEPLRLLDKLLIEHAQQGLQIGRLTGWNEYGKPLVVLPGEKSEAREAQTTVLLRKNDVGRAVAILYERCGYPVVIGLLETAQEPVEENDPKNCLNVVLDGQRVELRAEDEIVLRCGNASLTLTRAGKVLIRGAYICTRATGQNSIKGATVHIN
jgi:hypothetical protein